jgi:myo-inositol 2-dehydrogenase/D-chiro-inositol 1-dehydrogenase
MSDTKLKVGIIGGGGIVRAHLPQLVKRNDAVEVAAVSDVNAEAARKTAEEYSIPRHATDYNEWLADVDAVVIGVPTHLHHLIGIDAANAGKAIFMEKPLTRTRAQADELLAAVEKNGVPFQVGFVRRFDDEWLGWRALVQKEKIGKPVIWRNCSAGFGAPNPWFNQEELGGGPFIDGCIHNYDFALHTFGPAKWAFANLCTLRESNTALDTGTATIRFQSGDELMLAWSWGLPQGTSGAHTFEFLGPRGVLKYSGEHEFLIQTENQPDGSPSVETIPYPQGAIGDAFNKQMDEFIAVAQGETKPRAGAQEGLESLKLALAVLESGRTGRVVEL